MTIVVTGGQQVTDGGYRSVKSYSGSTATAIRTLDLNYDVHNLGMSTAATVGINIYLLPTDDAYEGREVAIQATATGTASLLVGGGTATGHMVFAAATDLMRYKQFNAVWFLEQNTGATFATATD
jgi:hypothetical protein